MSGEVGVQHNLAASGLDRLTSKSSVSSLTNRDLKEPEAGNDDRSRHWWHTGGTLWSLNVKLSWGPVSQASTGPCTSTQGPQECSNNYSDFQVPASMGVNALETSKNSALMTSVHAKMPEPLRLLQAPASMLAGPSSLVQATVSNHCACH